MTRWAPGAAVGYARTLVPGLLVTALVAMAAAFLGSHYKGSVLLFALLLGLALHFISEDQRCAAGIQFASSTVLRLGVALLGLRLSIDHLVSLGWRTAAALVVAVSLTIALGLLLARLLKVEGSLGVLIGGATAICGASAALAISSVLPRSPSLERDTTLTVVGVTTLSTAAMVIYPLITQWLGFDALTAGLFIGATIHDVAQVVGAGVQPVTCRWRCRHHHEADAGGTARAGAGGHLDGDAPPRGRPRCRRQGAAAALVCGGLRRADAAQQHGLGVA